MSEAARPRFVYSANLDLRAAFARSRSILPDVGFADSQSSISSWPGYCPTPLVQLPGLAERLGVGEIAVKDEAQRFGLGSFKALGGSYAVFCLLADSVAAQTGRRPTARDLISGAHGDIVSDVVVTCTTDGNHGRSVAWGAALFGCHCVIYVHRGVTERRVKAIGDLGAEVVRAGDTYDESVDINARDAATKGWHVVADTSVDTSPPETIAIMQGYRVMAEEVLAELKEPPTHVLLQVGCGGFAASVVAHLLSRVDNWPHIVGVEPERAACLAPSIAAGRPVTAAGDLETVMAGLSVGNISRPAWQILGQATEAVAVISEQAAATAMQVLADGRGGDPSIVSGESGAAGLAGLMAVVGDQPAQARLRLGGASRVLLVSTEGATDPIVYEQLVGRPPNPTPSI